MNRVLTRAICLFLLGLAGCSSSKPAQQQYVAAANSKPLTAAESKAAVSGNSITGTSSGGTYKVYFDPSGQERGVWTKGADTEHDTGVWSINDEGMFCEKWTKWEDAQQKCWHFYRNAGGSIDWVKPDGSDDTGDTVFYTGNYAKL